MSNSLRFGAALFREVFGVSPDALLAEKRGAPKPSFFRNLLMHLRRVEYGETNQVIGDAFGRREASVRKASAMVERFREDTDFDAAMIEFGASYHQLDRLREVFRDKTKGLTKRSSAANWAAAISAAGRAMRSNEEGSPGNARVMTAPSDDEAEAEKLEAREAERQEAKANARRKAQHAARAAATVSAGRASMTLSRLGLDHLDLTKPPPEAAPLLRDAALRRLLGKLEYLAPGDPAPAARAWIEASSVQDGKRTIRIAMRLALADRARDVRAAGKAAYHAAGEQTIYDDLQQATKADGKGGKIAVQHVVFRLFARKGRPEPQI